jgi:protein TonB
MNVLNYIVVSKKIQYSDSFLKSKSFALSLGIHTTLFACVVLLMHIHPIPLRTSDEKITISLAEFRATTGDMHPMETTSKTKESLKTITHPTPKPEHFATTPQQTLSLTPSVSAEASAPLAHPQTLASTPPLSHGQNDSPHLTSSPPEHELPRNTVSDNQIGGAALGHIRAMIEKSITYPTTARKLHVEGVVLMTFTLKADGTVDTAHVKNSSGSSILDTKAIQTILNLSGQYPALGKTFELSVPITFTLS